MIDTRFDLELAVRGHRLGSAGSVLRSMTFFEGNLALGGRAVNRLLEKNDLVVPDPAGVTVDLQLDDGNPDVPLDLAAVRFFYCRASKLNDSPVLVDFGILNGWSYAFQDQVLLQPGDELLWMGGASAAANVLPAQKLIPFTVSGGVGGDQVLEKLFVLGATL